MSDFLGLADKTILVAGLANKKSVAWHVHKGLLAAGATVVNAMRSEARHEQLAALLAPSEVLVCDVEREGEIERLAAEVRRRHPALDGLVHSIAFASYGSSPRAFHETRKLDFLQAVDVSCYSLIALAPLHEAPAVQAEV